MKRSVALVVVLALVLSACATYRTHRLTVGDTLVDLGQQFHRTADLYDRAVLEGAITKEEYANFWMFAERFKVVYERAGKLYIEGGDLTTVRAFLDELREELVLWALKRSQP